MIRVTADLHLRLDVPLCRGETEEEWLMLQRKSLEEFFNVPGHRDKLVIAGDIFHRPVSSPKLVNMIHDASYCNEGDGETYIMAGNHDLQMRNKDVSATSYQSVLYGENFMPIENTFSCIPYDEEKPVGPKTDILFLHRLVFPSDSAIPPGSDGISAKDLLALYPDYRLIVAGDNHDGFLYEEKGRVVLVPGSMTIQSAKAIDKRCYFYDIDFKEQELKITKHLFPDTGNMVTREHIDKANEREERLTAFVEALKKGGETSFDFEASVLGMLNNSDMKEDTKTMVKEFLYG